MKFKEYKSLNLTQINNDVLKKWDDEKTFSQSLKIRKGCPTFTFYEGPPSANGVPGIHHVMARAIKDIFCRYKTQKGFFVKRKAGWDTHGLPVELGVEKMLGITKEDIGKKISVDDYNSACRKEVMKYTELWENLTRQMGYWIDMSDPYITYSNDYIETLWFLLKDLYNKDLLYKGYTIQPYSPAAGTGLSTHELNQPGCYRDVKDRTAVAMFHLKSPLNPPQGDLQTSKPYNTANVATYEFLKENAKNRRKNPTEAEDFLWKNLQNKQLEGYKFRREHVIGDFIVDFVCLSKQLIIEVDGGYHREENQQELDKIRSEYLINKGFRVIRFTNEEVLNNIEKTLETIETALHQSSTEGDLGNLYFLAWTTTPWTLPSNTALCVGENIVYNLVKTTNPYKPDEICTLILAKERVSAYFGEKKVENFEIAGEILGKDLVGLEYEQLIPYTSPLMGDLGGCAFKVIAGDYVTTDDGTGIVHIAPTFGADDDRVAKQNSIVPMLLIDKNGKKVPMVDLTGKFYKIEDLDENFVKTNVNVELYKNYAGKFVKKEYEAPLNPPSVEETPCPPVGDLGGLSLDDEICIWLKSEGLLFKSEKYVHAYPHCWRTDKPVLYYPLDSWFIKTTACREEMMKLNDTINWKPQSTGTGRFGKWLENLQDWNLSRTRYWGTPLPIWITEDGSQQKCIGSIRELYDEIEKSVAAGFMTENPYKTKGFIVGDMSKENYEKIDLHRPYIDDIVLVSDTGEPMKREIDLIDVWFDSGAMPFAQQHYMGNELNSFPADFIAEGVDQTRGWFFTLHAIATMVKGEVSFKNVISNGLVLDKSGNKMSKRLGNAVEPFAVMNEYGSDTLRWYMITNSQPWDNLKFDIAGVDEVKRKFFGTLYNTYSFFSLYANVDNYQGNEPEIPVNQRPEIDVWIISLLNSLVKEVENAYENYEPTRAGRAIQDFVLDNLSNWYVRLNRKRFWGGKMNDDKLAAYQTLQKCLETVALLASPIAPFFCDNLFCDLNEVSQRYNTNSVHLANFPDFDESLINTALEEKMNIAQQVCSMVLALRRKANKKVRQPLTKILIPVLDVNTKNNVEAVKHLILSEVNVKELEFLDDTTGIIVKKIKPNFKTLGKVYGKQMKEISAAITAFSQQDISNLERQTTQILNLPSGDVNITIDDVEITSEDIPGWLVATEGKLTIALDITITPELFDEGIAREIINRIQNIRKNSNFDVTDKINVQIEKNEIIEKAVNAFRDYISSQTLAANISFTEYIDNGTDMELDEISIKTKIEKIS